MACGVCGRGGVGVEGVEGERDTDTHVRLTSAPSRPQFKHCITPLDSLIASLLDCKRLLDSNCSLSRRGDGFGASPLFVD